MGKTRSGGQILIDGLRGHGVDHVFCVPGESYLAALDALHGQDAVRTVVCRHEGAAAMMADAYGKLTHCPGVCFVTRGPGATNAAGSRGTHRRILRICSTPLVLFAPVHGCTRRRSVLRRPSRPKSTTRATMYGGKQHKRVEQIEDPARIPR